MAATHSLTGRLVLTDRVVPGRLVIGGGRIVELDLDEATVPGVEAALDVPLIAPGFVDVHVHGWGGHDAMGDRAALDGMARALARRGVTSFLPTAVSAPLDVLAAFTAQVRAWVPGAPDDGAAPLGANLEGPFLAPTRRGAHDPGALVTPADVSHEELAAVLRGARLVTVAPELPGALELIAWLRGQGLVVSLGHSAADVSTARAGYAAGATSTTHLFNAMSALEHRAPGLALAALLHDEAFVELIADGHHVDAELWTLIRRLKPAGRLLLVSDAVALAGTDTTTGRLGGVEVEVADGRVTLAGTTTLAGSVLSLDDAVRRLIESGASLPEAVLAASRTPLDLLGVEDRGRLAVGQRADLVELDDGLAVRGVWLAGRRLDA